MFSSIPAECEAGADPGGPRAEALSQVRQERATARHACSPVAPRVRHQRATSLPSAAEGSEGRPPRSDRAARGARRACWRRQARPARTRRPPRSRAGMRQRASHGERRDVAVRAPSAFHSATATSSQPKPGQAFSLAHSRSPTIPQPRSQTSACTPPQRLGRASHLPWRTLKIYPQHIGTQLSLYPGPGIMRHMPALLPRPFPVCTTRGATGAVPEDPRDGPDRRLVR